MAGYTLGLCGRRMRDHLANDDSWMLLPPYPQYPVSVAAAAAAAAAGSAAAAAGLSVVAAAAGGGLSIHHGHHSDYGALVSGSIQQQQQQQHHQLQRRSPLSSAAYTHSCILEMRKEKSRDAARSRRGKENYEFYELAKMLPLPPAITSQLDKASIIRLTISFLKLKDFSSNGDPAWLKENKPLKLSSRSRSPNNLTLELFDQHQGTHILQSLDGFAFSLGSDGRFLYISETVSIYLGLSQVEMTGSSVFDYVHAGDHAELAEQLGLTLANQNPSAQSANQMPPSPASATGSVEDGSCSMNPDVTSLMSLESNSAYKGLDRSFCIRMKSTLTKRGCHFKSSGYRVVMILCRLRTLSQFSNSKLSEQQSLQQQQPLLGMIALAIALPPPTVYEVRLEPDMFVTRLSFDLRIIHCEPRVSDLIDFAAEDLTGRSLYTLCHAEDVRLLRKSHTDLMHKGQVMTSYYRILNRHGGFTWLQSCATVVCNSKNGDEQSIVSVNYVLSRTEMNHWIMDHCQLESPALSKMTPFKGGDSTSARPVSPEDNSLESEQRFKSSNGGGGGAVDVASTSSSLSSATSSTLADNQRTSPEVQVVVAELSAAAAAAAVDGRSASRNARHHHTRSAKRKYDQVAINSIIEASLINASPAAGSNHADDPSGALNDADAEAEASRWKRLYGAASGLDGDALHDRNMDASNFSGGASSTDFSADALLSSSKQRATIQWIGAPPAPSAAAAASALSVPSLLRQIYASRESVIRANVHANRSGGGGGGGGVGGFFHNSNGDLSAPATSASNGGPSSADYSAAHDVFPPTSSYSASAGFLPEYLPAMTPPSSVSPRDAAGALFAAEASLRHTYSLADNNYATAQPLPLKPHVYGVHGIDPASSATYTNQSSLPHLSESAQFYPHTSPGFYIYHPQASKTAPSNTSSWYSN